ncbi:hypothetical protein cyc_07093 [Cyclospora cayetanensis]|uniref:Uncharacterized protein n=1 Tax=Cyclospora cayetanensis TaxID=88456 RepID=A0A1D3D2K9_9EIME|nr:hypothetical protein cyc_07093 [Cyclospora cayetanensis]
MECLCELGRMNSSRLRTAIDMVLSRMLIYDLMQWPKLKATIVGASGMLVQESRSTLQCLEFFVGVGLLCLDLCWCRCFGLHVVKATMSIAATEPLMSVWGYADLVLYTIRRYVVSYVLIAVALALIVRIC